MIKSEMAQRARSASPEQLAELHDEIAERVINRMVDQKLLFADAADKLPAEALPHIEKQFADRFEEYEVPRMLKAGKLKSREELDEKLQEMMGMSLEQRRSAFIEQAIAMQWIREQINIEQEIAYSDIAAYYREHADEFQRSATTIWEHLMTRTVEFPSKKDAFSALCEMGNAVMVQKRPWEDVAKEKSHGPTADKGGRCEWTGEESLDDKLVEAIKGLPVGEMSKIIGTWQGFHIVRVVERRPAGIAPFEEVQKEIAKKLKLQRAERAEEKFLAELRAKRHVWTILDDCPEAQAARQVIGAIR